MYVYVSLVSREEEDQIRRRWSVYQKKEEDEDRR